MAKHLILCDCLGSQSLDPAKLSRATGLKCSRLHTALCTHEVEAASAAILAGDAIIACKQEQARFEEIAADLNAADPTFVDIRDRAGWSDDKLTTPKMAALIAEALLEQPGIKTLDVTSEGMCLIIGTSAVAIPAAGQLADVLTVTVLLTDAGDLPLSRKFEVIRGTNMRATGTLGNFRIQLDALEQLDPGGRGDLAMTPPRDGAETRCDVILDLTGGTPLFPAPKKRDGYLRADPRNPAAVAAAAFEAAQHIGTFEKPFYIALEDHLCAHSRAGQTGCTRCLDVCPTGAITPNGDHVSIDPMICAGCGACSALCPSGAISYDAPSVSYLLRRIQILAETFLTAGGANPRLLIHDAKHGTEMIGLAARFGRGLPADVVPLGVEALASVGHAEMLAALATGFCSVDILLAPESERDVLERECALAMAMGGNDRLRLLDIADPEVLSGTLYADQPSPLAVAAILPMGSRRQIARLAGKALNVNATEPLPLPEGAPYGAVLVDTEACTLCLSCASLCPSGAIIENPDKPQLRFQEDACLQCGICATVCPENAIRLVPRFDPSDAAYDQQILNEEEPFCCIECSKPFGVKSTVEKIMEKLAGKHSMFIEGGAGRLIQMCDDCRIQTQYHSTNSPMASAERPRVRTTDDYLSKRKDH
ncbi:MAG: 4Fe-4S binding protein [Albidovulum sp.]